MRDVAHHAAYIEVVAMMLPNNTSDTLILFALLFFIVVSIAVDFMFPSF